MKMQEQLTNLEAALQVVLDEVLEAAHDFEQKAKRLQDLKPTDPRAMKGGMASWLLLRSCSSSKQKQPRRRWSSS